MGQVLNLRSEDPVKLDSHKLWMQRAESIFRRDFTKGQLVTGEMLRMHLILSGLEQPKHSNAWGTVTRTLAMRGLLQNTGRYKKMSNPTSHSRRNPVWRVK
jgi:hypothetical protein